MKKLISFIAAFVIVGASATSVLALPGSSVSISGAQFNFSSSNFTTGSSSSSVIVQFLDPSDTQTALFTDAQLIMSPISFTSGNFITGFTGGTGGGFSILSSVISGSVPLLIGSFGPGSTLAPGPGSIVFEASLISSFSTVGPVGTPYFPPGSFSATMNILSGNFDSNWTTTGGSVATISSTVPEPASLLLLGAGLAGIGLWSWRRKSTR